MGQRRLTKTEMEQLIVTLRERFEANRQRHPELDWVPVEARLKENDTKMWSLYEMEQTGGEPDVVDYDLETDEYIFVDCSRESPAGRRSLCYDGEARQARKKNPPENSALELAEKMGIELLTEGQYRRLQTLGEFDLKTSSWIKTPEQIRNLGAHSSATGAITLYSSTTTEPTPVTAQGGSGVC